MQRRLPSPARRASRRARRGMTLVEVILAVVIMSGAMLGLANFVRKFQRGVTDNNVQALASDLATQRLEQIKGDRVYLNLVTNYNATTETFPGDPTYNGFTRTTAAVRCASCPTATNDYVTITVSISGNQLATTMKKTTIIAKF